MVEKQTRWIAEEFIEKVDGLLGLSWMVEYPYRKQGVRSATAERNLLSHR